MSKMNTKENDRIHLWGEKVFAVEVQPERSREEEFTDLYLHISFLLQPMIWLQSEGPWRWRGSCTFCVYAARSVSTCLPLFLQLLISRVLKVLHFSCPCATQKQVPIFPSHAQTCIHSVCFCSLQWCFIVKTKRNTTQLYPPPLSLPPLSPTQN